MMDLHEHLSQMETSWSVVDEAHHGTEEQRRRARAELLARYHPVVKRYLWGAVRNEDIAHDLLQEFAKRLLAGQFHNVSPDKGRFRSYLKTCLFRLVLEHRTRRGRQRLCDWPGAGWEPVDQQPNQEALDQEWEQDWRQTILTRAFETLQRQEGDSGRSLFTVLRLRIDQPSWTSEQMARHLSLAFGKPITAVLVRKRLVQAREALSRIIIAEVSSGLEVPSRDNVLEELCDLGLLKYCEAFLERHGEACCC